MACALLVSIGSWWMFPRSFISFGVLHGMALMLILVRFGFSRLPTAARWVLGAVALALPFFISDPFFDTRTTNWVGLVTRKPLTASDSEVNQNPRARSAKLRIVEKLES